MSVIISQTVIYCTVIQFGIDSFSGMERMKTINRTGVIFLLACVCCFLWGSASPSIKTGYELFQIAESDTWSIILFAGIRFFLAGLLVILFESIKEKRVVLPEKGSGKAIVILSLAQTILQYFFFYLGLAHTSGVTGTILSGTGGFLSIIMAACIFRLEKITVNKLLGIVLGLAGVVLMNLSPGSGQLFSLTLMGEGLILRSQVSYALSGILVKKFSSRFSVVMLSGWQFILGGAVMAMTGIVMGGHISLSPGPSGLLLMIYLALISAVAYTLWGTLMKYNPVSRVAIFNFLTPLFGVILSAIFLNELEQALQPNKLLALILVCLGIFIVNVRKD